jgi:hypothetical protein
MSVGPVDCFSDHLERGGLGWRETGSCDARAASFHLGVEKADRQARWLDPARRLPIAPFRVCGKTLDYRFLTVRDELAPLGDGTWVERGLLLGRQFCRFRLVRPPGTKS